MTEQQPTSAAFTAYKVRWVQGVPEVWAYSAFGDPRDGVRGHVYVGVARNPEEYITHVR